MRVVNGVVAIDVDHPDQSSQGDYSRLITPFSERQNLVGLFACGEQVAEIVESANAEGISQFHPRGLACR
jgi:hypothetical protein